MRRVTAARRASTSPPGSTARIVSGLHDTTRGGCSGDAAPQGAMGAALIAEGLACARRFGLRKWGGRRAQRLVASAEMGPMKNILAKSVLGLGVAVGALLVAPEDAS